MLRPKRKRQRPDRNNVETVSFVSLGCPKNLVDSEKMLGLLAQDGLIPVPADQPADAVVVNTCGFLEASKEESISVINEVADLKKAGQVKRLVVAGCLVQRHRAKMLDWCPDIDAMVGVFDRDHITTAVKGTGLGGQARDVVSDVPVYSSIAANATIAQERSAPGSTPQPGYFESDSSRLRLTPRHYAYLRISEGCNQNCAFCTIPSIRGKMRSKPIDKLLAEAQELMNDGAFELNLIGQDTTSFGDDIGYGPGLAGMLTELDKLASTNGGAWIRLMYAYPSCFTDEMIDTIASLPNVVKYIDMPLQHINDRVLDVMRRKTSRKLIETLLNKLRDRIPGMAIRTTFISGFPTETDEEHQELVTFIKDFGFEALGVFPYSPEPGTPAGTLHANDNAIPQDVIDARIEELMLTQQELAFARNTSLANAQETVPVLIEGISSQDVGARLTPGVDTSQIQLHRYSARSIFQAPEVDAITYVHSREELSPGEVIDARIVDSADYDLVAQPETDLSKDLSLPVIN